MKTEYKYIRFMCLGDTGKTSRWSIHNIRTQAFLGEIKWYSAWRQYCFFTTMDSVFNDSCMLDILDFIKQLSAAHNSERPRTGLQHGQPKICPQCNGSGRPGLQLRFGESCSACHGTGKLQA
jgi:hypothetical protein